MALDYPTDGSPSNKAGVPMAQREREVTQALNNLINKVSFITEASENLEKRIDPVLIHPDNAKAESADEARKNVFTTPLANSIQAQVYRLEYVGAKICRLLDMLEI